MSNAVDALQPLSHSVNGASTSLILLHTTHINAKKFHTLFSQTKTTKQPLQIMSSADNTSTLKSYVDSATGAIQSGVASLTGNASDQVCPSAPLVLSCAA
jgi:hypothetical protein